VVVAPETAAGRKAVPTAIASRDRAVQTRPMGESWLRVTQTSSVGVTASNADLIFRECGHLSRFHQIVTFCNRTRYSACPI
jgi:hypothetical protein